MIPRYCTCCNKLLTDRDHITYGSRCEDCWAGGDWHNGVPQYGAARCYADRLLGELGKRFDGRVVHKDSHS